jgi:hypothetical protein
VIADTDIHREQGDLISPLTKIRGDGLTDRQQGDLISLKNEGGYTGRWTEPDREQGNLIRLLSYFQNKESGLKMKNLH